MGVGRSPIDRRRKKRLPFDEHDLNRSFRQGNFEGRRLRSGGNAGEATYRVASWATRRCARKRSGGLAAADIVADGFGGDCFDVADRPGSEDEGLAPHRIAS